MHLRMAAGLALVLAVVPPPIGGGSDSADSPPPVTLAGARSASTRTANGGLERSTLIPTDSALSQYGGGPANGCIFTADHDDFELTNGQTVPKGTQVTGTYQFQQGTTITMPLIPSTAPVTTPPPSAGPLEAATMTFTVFCAGAKRDLASRGYLIIPLLDPFIDPHHFLTTLRNNLQLTQPTVFTNPIVATYGGLVTRYPTWLAIAPDAWTTQTSPIRTYRGTPLQLIAQPRDLDFTIVFTPKQGTGGRAATTRTTCIDGNDRVADSVAMPALPTLPDQTEPGLNEACMWTPPGPGKVTMTATITYSITFSAGGYTEPDDDYTWSSPPTTFVTGELTAVNTKP